MHTIARAVTLAGLIAVGCGPSPEAEPGSAGRADPAAPDDAHVHFLIPGAPGGGWDGTARGVGVALQRSGLAARVSFENLSGGGGGRAIAHLIATAPRQQDTWMVASTPIVLRSLRGRLPQSFRDLTPIAAVIGDTMTFAVRADSPLRTWADMLEAYETDARTVKVAGGSVRGGLDHLVTALALQAAGESAAALRYVGYDTGGKALVALLSGEVDLLATGLGEAMEAKRGGQIRLLGIAAASRSPDAPSVPTLAEHGTPFEFVNWRGFFGPPGLGEDRVRLAVERLTALFETEQWNEVRRRNGWVEMFKPDREFARFLDEQERAMADVYRRLGMSVRDPEIGS